MTEFEKKLLQEVKGINKELHELNKKFKKEPPMKNGIDVSVASMIASPMLKSSESR